MWLLWLALTIGQPGPGADPPPGETPGELHLQVFSDLQRSDPAARRDALYLSLAGYTAAERAERVKTVTSLLNRTSWRRQLYTPEYVTPALIRVDLAAIGWDRPSRQKRIDRLKQLGVDTGSFKADFREELAKADPFYFTTTADAYGTVVRGWLDPEADAAIRAWTHGSKVLFSAAWLVAQVARDDVEGDKGGFYSQALLLPPTEGDLFKAMGVNALVAEPAGAGVVKSDAVALHNRELQLMPSLVGYDLPYLWRSLDVAEDKAGEKNVFDAIAGTLKRDGSEHIFSLPNGLGGGYACNAEGKQVAIVPENIAHDFRPNPPRNVRDRRVVNGYKCWDCHDSFGYIYPFVDDVGPATRDKGLALVTVSKDKNAAAAKAADVGDYYFADLPTKAELQRRSYEARFKEMNGRAPGDDARLLCDAVEEYVWDPVTPEQAAREMGVPLAVAVERWRTPVDGRHNNQLVILASGRPVRRGAWEQAWADAMRSDVYPWDHKVKVKESH